jgi:hypothetical protein
LKENVQGGYMTVLTIYLAVVAITASVTNSSWGQTSAALNGEGELPMSSSYLISKILPSMATQIPQSTSSNPSNTTTNANGAIVPMSIENGDEQDSTSIQQSGVKRPLNRNELKMRNNFQGLPPANLQNPGMPDPMNPNPNQPQTLPQSLPPSRP